LDDIASELDNNNTKKIFGEKHISKQQTFITIVDYKQLPKEIIAKAQLIDLNAI
jgi:recombinational DNA repair ATPase RecF